MNPGRVSQVLHMIGGKEVPSASGRTFVSVNPATTEAVAEVAEGDEEDIDRAVQAAYQAFTAGPWPSLPPRERGRLLLKMSHLITEHSEDLARLDTLDIGKPISYTKGRDIPGSARIFEFFSGVRDKFAGSVYSGESGYHSYTIREPYGVVGIITPWNSPFLSASAKIAPAIAAGNTIVIKMAEQSPLSVLELSRLCLAAGIPEGVVNVVHGYGPTAGAALVRHPLVGKIVFTGSTSVGKEVLKSAGEQVKPVSLELGGKSANIIFADADLDQALEGSVFTAFYNTGQICTSGSRLLVQASVADKILDTLTRQARALKIGDPFEEATQLGPLVSAEQLDRVTNYIRLGIEQGARLALGGEKPSVPDPLSSGYFISPAIFLDVAPQMRIAQEEIFGPILSVLPFQDVHEAMRIANSVVYGLAASVWTNDLRKAFALAEALDSGTVWVNTVNYRDNAVPWSGRKESGFGEEMGADAMRTYTKLKTVYIKYGVTRPTLW